MFDKYMLIFNGKFYPVDNFSVDFENRAMLYGDSIFETMYSQGSNIPFFSDHILRIKAGMQVLEYNISEKFEIYPNKLYNEIIKLIHKNKLFSGARVKLMVFRTKGGYYTPQNNDAEYIITAEKAPSQYELNEKGYTLGVFEKIKKPVNIFANYKTANNLINILAGKYSAENKFDDSIILNSENNICETVSSNIFCKKDNKILTPALSEGCVAGIIRKNVIKTAKMTGVEIKETILTKQNLLDSDEVFLTNTITGVRWVLAFEKKRYYNTYSKKLIKILNDCYTN